MDVSTLDPTAQIIIVTISIVQRKSLHTERFRNLPKVTQLIKAAAKDNDQGSFDTKLVLLMLHDSMQEGRG